LPAYTKRSSDSGCDVRMERRVVRLRTDRSSGTVNGNADAGISNDSGRGWNADCSLSPTKFLTKICMVGDASGEADLEVEERMMVVGEAVER
jgi:hypothetical protein